jgi:hypothetical protein
MGWEGVDTIIMTVYRSKQQAAGKEVIKLRVPYIAGNFLTNEWTSSLLRWLCLL